MVVVVLTTSGNGLEVLSRLYVLVPDASVVIAVAVVVLVVVVVWFSLCDMPILMASNGVQQRHNQ